MAFDRDHTPFATNGNGTYTSGVALAADATLIYESAAAAAYFRQQVSNLAVAGASLSVAAHWSCASRNSASIFRFLCELLGGAMDEANVPARQLGLQVGATSLPPQLAREIRGAHLGDGPLYVRASPQTIQECHWEQLWRLRTDSMVRLVYAEFVTSPCRLLPAEVANGVTPGTDIQAPTGSAWVIVPVDILSFTDQAGDIDEAALEQELRAGVEQGDKAHTLARWPTAQMRHDGWLNRRLAINLTGIGTLIQHRNADPARFNTLDDMCRLIRRIRDIVLAQSQHIAGCAGNVPALEQSDLGRLLPGGQLRDGWSRRWRQEVTATAVRHRNLLVMSPWSLFPPGNADLRYANLLPLLRYADAASFGAPQQLSAWSLKDFRTFHQQAAAVLQQRGTTHQIAVQA